MDFSKRSRQKELLDMDSHPYESIRRNMEELNVINTYLGGHQVTIRGLQQLIQQKEEITICEIGCGGGDNLMAIRKWCEKRRIKSNVIGIDINPFCIQIAESLFGSARAKFIVSDYRLVHLENLEVDIVFSSLFCHHFSEMELEEMLKWMYGNSKMGFFINDLHRNPIAYYSIRVLTALFSRSFLVKNDAPISVLRGFSKVELIRLLEGAKLQEYQIKWQWAFRWLILVKKKLEHG